MSAYSRPAQQAGLYMETAKGRAWVAAMIEGGLVPAKEQATEGNIPALLVECLPLRSI